jgi:tetraacyldisaccharide 4'-kinase
MRYLVARLAQIAAQVWNPRSVAGKALWAALVPPAVVYGTAIRGRNLLYDRGWWQPVQTTAAVVSVGNLTVGGTGKTPLVQWLAEKLEQRGSRVAILSRGYGRRSHGVRVVADGGRCLINVEEAGDEPTLLGRRARATVVVGERRVAAAKTAVERGANVLLLDDGFQHRALARDFDLLLLDRNRPFANGWTLPAGPLREPCRGAARAHALVVLERGTQHSESEAVDGLAARVLAAKPCFQAALKAKVLVVPEGQMWVEEPLGSLAGQRILAVAGVAEAESFYAMLHQWEGRLVGALEFGDHHRYDPADWRAITAAARGADLIVTTEKDLVKLERFPFARGTVVGLRVGVEVEDADGLLSAVGAAIDGARPR